LPLFEDRGRSRDNNGLRFLTQEQLARDQARFDRLPKTRIVGDEEIDAGQTKRLAQGLHLVGVDFDAGPEWRLNQIWIRCRDTVPPQRMEESRELRIKPFGS